MLTTCPHNYRFTPAHISIVRTGFRTSQEVMDLVIRCDVKHMSSQLKVYPFKLLYCEDQILEVIRSYDPHQKVLC